ncbi:hypothetical protein L1987_79913 [Smallanthus sonchifolius]|uniref:Uncharacterized protein n=1 Tax=Smallanthus sonchifolius TaxID=185202 RepID=A0ACB8YLN5_9ASTR|nr:hypothetical protein L1987_79913 [Smallanthus sonchifolius]
MRKIDQKQRHGGGGRIGGNNGFIPSSFRSLSSYLRIVSSGASTVASTVRSAASAASTIVDRDADATPDQVLWAGFDKLECDGGISHRVLLLGYQSGFQVWDVEDANNVRNIVSRYDGAVSFMKILPKPAVSNHSRVEYLKDCPLLVLCADGSFSAGGNGRGGPTVSNNGNMKNNNDQVNGGCVPTVVWFYSLKSQSYIKELKFRSVVYSVRCSSRVVAVLQAAQVHCFDVTTLEREYTILTNPIVTSSSRFEYIGLGPLAMGPRWIAYSGSMVALPNTCVSPQHLSHSKTFTASGSYGSIVAHYAKQSSKQLAVGIVSLGDIGYKKLSRYYSEFLPDGNISQQPSDLGRKDHGNSNGRLPDTENVGMVIVRDVVSKSVIAQFKAHDSPIASLCFDPSGTLLVTASVHGHSFNVFRIIPGSTNGASYIHLYRLQRGFTNAVIQDISFSVDSRWITISSSRGTSHLFAISPSGGPVNMQSAEEFLTTSSQGCTYDAANKPPVTLSATPIWAKPQIYFQSLTIDDINVDGENNLKGEMEIEKIPTHTVEARSRHLVLAVDYLQRPDVQITRFPALDINNNVLYEHEKLFSHGSRFEASGGLENDDEETGEDAAGQTPIKDANGFVNSDGCPISHTLPETVDNREHSVSGTRSELVNNNIGQKLENHFEDQGAEFD